MGAIPMSWLVLPPMSVTFGSHVKTFLPCAWQSRMLSLVQCSEYTNAIREQEPGLLRLHDRTISSQRVMHAADITSADCGTTSADCGTCILTIYSSVLL